MKADDPELVIDEVDEFALVPEPELDDLLAVIERDGLIGGHSVTQHPRSVWTPEEELLARTFGARTRRKPVIEEEPVREESPPLRLVPYTYPVRTYWVAVPPLTRPSEAVAWHRAGVEKLLEELADSTVARVPYCALKLIPTGYRLGPA